MSKTGQMASLIAWMGVCFAAGAIGSLASLQAAAFYKQLVLPAWAPPASVFGPVWTVLYALMGVAAWRVWLARDNRQVRTVLTLFVVQLALNAVWSWLFFHWRLGGLAFLDILLLWVLIIATTIRFWRIRPPAGMLFVPYLLWVSFAAALNYSIWRMNPQLLGWRI